MPAAVTPVVVVDLDALPKNAAPMRMALFDESGNPVAMLLTEVPTGADVLLTGFSAGSAAALAATDTTNEAFAKLEARIVALESA